MQVEQCDVGFGVGIILVPPHARRHRQQLRNGHVVIRRTLKVGNIGRDHVVDTFDIAILDGRADKGRGEGLGDGEACPLALRVKIETVFFNTDLAILDNDEASGTLRLHIGINIHINGQRFALGHGIDRVTRFDDV